MSYRVITLKSLCTLFFSSFLRGLRCPWFLKGFMVLSENYPINFSVTSATFFMPRTFLTANNCKANEDFLEISFGFDT